MNSLMKSNKENKLLALSNKELTITSVELVDIINSFRKEEFDILTANGMGSKYTELKHKDFMKKIRKEVEVMETLGLVGERNISPSSYINSQNKKQPCFELNRDGMLQMLNSESTIVRAKTIEYINHLEKELKENRYVSDSQSKKLLAGELVFNGTNPAALSELIRLTESSIDGKGLVITLGQLVDRLNISGLSTTIFNDWLVYRVLGEKVKFGDEKRYTFQPNENWFDFFCADGMSITGTTTTGKVKVEYTHKMTDIINKHYREDLIRYVDVRLGKLIV